MVYHKAARHTKITPARQGRFVGDCRQSRFIGDWEMGYVIESTIAARHRRFMGDCETGYVIASAIAAEQMKTSSGCRTPAIDKCQAIGVAGVGTK